MPVQETKKLTSIRRRQNFCGGIFTTMFVFQLVYQLMIFHHGLEEVSVWFSLGVGLLSVIGFGTLFTLASNMASSTFAIFLTGIELFFAVGRPILHTLSLDDKRYYAIVFYICVAFCFVALYLWTVLLNNSKFKRSAWPWILILPLPFVVNIIGYAGYLSIFRDINNLANIIISNGAVTPILRICLAVILPVGYWYLSHSDSFSGGPGYYVERANMSIFNYYALAYGILTIVLLLPFGWNFFG